MSQDFSTDEQAAPAKALYVQRPKVLAALCGALALCVLAAGAGYVMLWRSVAEGPVVVLTQAERLETVLERAPWSGDEAVAEEGPVVWALTGAPCAACPAFEAEDLASLRADGYAVRLIVVAQENAEAGDRDRAVALARAQTEADSPLEPGEAEGYAAWGRSVVHEVSAVLAANEAELELPALIWRRGAEWRVSVGRDPNARARIAEDLKPAA